MNNFMIPLNEVAVGHRCIVCSLLSEGTDRRRMLDLGIITGTQIEVLGKSPAGDPTSYMVRGAVIALRCEDAKKIMIRFS